MERSNDYMIVPCHDHYKVFCEGKDVAEVDTIDEALAEVDEYFNNKNN